MAAIEAVTCRSLPDDDWNCYNFSFPGILHLTLEILGGLHSTTFWVNFSCGDIIHLEVTF